MIMNWGTKSESRPFWLTFYFKCSELFFFVCLFARGYMSHSRIIYSYGVVTIIGKGLHILTYTRQSWPLSVEGSLSWHTYFDTGHLFTIISENSWHSHLLPSVLHLNCHYWDSNNQPYAREASTLTDCATAAVLSLCI